jgi:MFS transporter, FHS family, L-fucose permease
MFNLRIFRRNIRIIRLIINQLLPFREKESMNNTERATAKTANPSALTTLVTVFFFWGFFAAGNGVFIPFCKHYFSLDQFQSQLIDFAFYIAYYLGALALYWLAVIFKSDIISKWGFKNSIVFGLMFSAIGAAVMVAAVNFNSFPGMLVGLFVVALGFALQQTAANPFAAMLGAPETGAHRITLGGAVNSFGTAIGPIIVALALFGTTATKDEQVAGLGLSKVTVLYACVALLFIVAAALFYFSKHLPDGKSIQEPTDSPKALSALLIMTALLIAVFVPVFRSYLLASKQAVLAEDLQTERFRWLALGLIIILGTLIVSLRLAKKNPAGWGAMQYPQLVLGMLGIFVYVGTEVTIQSNLGELLHQPAFGGLPLARVAPFVSVYWGSLMVGRWTGSIKIFEPKKSVRLLLLLLVPLAAFGILLGVNAIAGNDISSFYAYIICIGFQAIAFWWVQDKPAKTLTVFSAIGFALMVIGIFTSGTVAIYAFLSGGLFCSVLWPCLFALSIAGLGKYTAQGASFLIMMILGGAIIPPIQGKMADIGTIGIHQSYWVPALGFLYLAWFGYTVKKTLLKQGIDYDNNISGGH